MFWSSLNICYHMVYVCILSFSKNILKEAYSSHFIERKVKVFQAEN